MSMNVSGVGNYTSTALYEKLFKRVDSNGDDNIDKTEFENAISSMATNQVSDSESIDSMFSKLDSDSDGTVSKDEMMAELKTIGEQRRAKMPPPPPDGQNGMGPDFQKMSQDFISKFDTNGDQTIDKSEFSAGLSSLSENDSTDSTDADAVFSKLDENGDGTVDQSELANGLKDMRPPMSPPQGEMSFSSDSSSTSDTSDSASTDAQNRLFADLVKSLKSSTNSENDMFSDLITSLKSSSGSSDDQITSMFNDLISNLQYGSSYSSQGNWSYNQSTTQTLMSILA